MVTENVTENVVDILGCHGIRFWGVRRSPPPIHRGSSVTLEIIIIYPTHQSHQVQYEKRMARSSTGPGNPFFKLPSGHLTMENCPFKDDVPIKNGDFP